MTGTAQKIVDYVTLAPGPTGGLTLPLDAYKLAFELLGRDLVFSQEGEKLRIVGPGGSKPNLTPEEIERIKRWKLHLLALLAYRAPDPPWL